MVMTSVDMTQVQTGDITIGILAIAAFGLLFLSRYLLQGQDANQTLQEDDTPTTLSSRGVFCNVVIGRRLVGPIFGWAGFRFTKEEVIGSVNSSKGGGGGGGGNITQTVYFEDGWHILGLGPGKSINAITEGGKNILPSPISKATTPSGSTITTEVGTFQVYWGDQNQPLCQALRDRLGGIDSTWPYLFYVLWLEKRLGTGPTWPDLKYDVTAMSCAENPDIIGSFEPNIADPEDGAYGVNPAAIFYQMITADYPHGAGMDPDKLDFTSLEALGLKAEEENLAMNLHIREGNNEITKWMQAMMLDAGVMLVDHPDGRLTLPLIREPVLPLPVVDQNYQTQPEVEVEVIPFDDVDQVDRVLFVFKNIDLRYRDDPIEFGDDGIAEQNGTYRIEKLRIETVTNKGVARKVANRRAPEVMGDLANIKYEVVRGASLLLPGQVFQDEEGRVVRVLSKQRKTTSPRATLDCGLDSYGLPILDDGDDGDTGGPQDAAQKDSSFTFVELPASIAGSQAIGIGVLRARANPRQAGARVYASIDDEVSFFVLGNQNPSAAGFSLSEAIAAADGPDLIEEGPLVVATNFDAGEVVNLSGQPAEWQNGRQLCVIEDTDGNTEAFFIREIELQAESQWVATTLYNIGDYVVPTALRSTGLRYKCVNASGTQLSDASEPSWPTVIGSRVTDNEVEWQAEHFSYQLLGLIRARFESPARDFAIGSKIWIIETDRINILRSTAHLTPGETVCIRTQPFTATEQFNIDNVTSVCKQLTGDAVTPAGVTYVIGADGTQVISSIGDRLIGRP